MVKKRGLQSIVGTHQRLTVKILSTCAAGVSRGEPGLKFVWKFISIGPDTTIRQIPCQNIERSVGRKISKLPMAILPL